MARIRTDGFFGNDSWTIEIVWDFAHRRWIRSLTPKRWIVERTFAWFSRFRRLARDFESANEDPAYR
jgi:transposase